jgi:hypothetical protein
MNASGWDGHGHHPLAWVVLPAGEEGKTRGQRNSSAKPKSLVRFVMGLGLVIVLLVACRATPARPPQAAGSVSPALKAAGLEDINSDCKSGALNTVYGQGATLMADWRRLEPRNTSSITYVPGTDRVFAIFVRGSCTGPLSPGGTVPPVYTVARVVVDEDGRVLYSTKLNRDSSRLPSTPPFSQALDGL